MKAKIIKFAMITGLSVILLSGCRKDLEVMEPVASQEKVTVMDQLKVADNFNWKTTQDVELTLTAAKKSTVIIKSATGIIYQKALLVPGEPYNSILTLPTYEKELTFVFNGKSDAVKISNKKIEHSF
ncbi:MAG: hypothetical protein WCK84_10100 [Bacteroidota bacterium]